MTLTMDYILEYRALISSTAFSALYSELGFFKHIFKTHQKCTLIEVVNVAMVTFPDICFLGLVLSMEKCFVGRR